MGPGRTARNVPPRRVLGIGRPARVRRQPEDLDPGVASAMGLLDDNVTGEGSAVLPPRQQLPALEDLEALAEGKHEQVLTGILRSGWDVERPTARVPSQSTAGGAGRTGVVLMHRVASAEAQPNVRDPP